MVWDVVMRTVHAAMHSKIESIMTASLTESMALVPPDLPEGQALRDLVPWLNPALRGGDSEETPRSVSARRQLAPGVVWTDAPVRPKSRQQVVTGPSEKRVPIADRLRQPHILVEMMRHGATLGSAAQQDFLKQVEALATDFRSLLLRPEVDMIRRINISQADAWAAVRGRRMSFIDGGVASIQSLGAEPLAIRVGAYSVTPGFDDEAREEDFRFVRVLVDELFEAGLVDDGVFDGPWEDTGKLRDAARISTEMAAVLEVLQRKQKPSAFVFAHGPLVNPVSPYALDGFPNFTDHALRILLDDAATAREGVERNFISVNLEQLLRVEAAGTPVIGVVERASTSRIVGICLLHDLQTRGLLPAGGRARIEEQLKLYRLTDGLIFEVLLEEGEYLRPLIYYSAKSSLDA